MLAFNERSADGGRQAKAPAPPPSTGRLIAFIALAAAVFGQDFDSLTADAARARDANRGMEAEALYRKAVVLRPGWAEGWWNLGTLLYDRNAWADAATAFEKAAALNPKVGNAQVMLGLCEYQLGRYDDALAHIERGNQLGISDDPQFWQVMLYHQGLLLLHKRDFEAAQEKLDSLAARGVRSDELVHPLGCAVLRVRTEDETPELQQPILRAGEAEYLAAQQKNEEAERAYAVLTADFPKTPGVHYAYGRFLVSSHADERAIAAFRRELGNNPRHLPALLAIAEQMYRLGANSGDGLRYAEQAVKLYPQVPVAHYFLGLLLVETKQPQRAITELETARRGMQDDSRVWFALARAYGAAQREQQAEQARLTFERLKKREAAARVSQ